MQKEKNERGGVNFKRGLEWGGTSAGGRRSVVEWEGKKGRRAEGGRV